MSKIQQELDRLSKTDVYSLVAFALFKSKDIPELSPISELPYLMDMKSMLNLCEYFGGQTIYVPTIDELEAMTYALTLFQLVDIEGQDKEEVSKNISSRISYNFSRIEDMYDKLCEILHDYRFVPR